MMILVSMKRIVAFLALSIFIVNASCTTPQSAEDLHFGQYISSISLLAHPDRYDKQEITVRGYISVDYNERLDINRRHNFLQISENSILLDLQNQVRTPWQRLLTHNHYCTVTGIFVYEGPRVYSEHSADTRGHSPGTLYVRRMECDPEYTISYAGELQWNGFWWLALEFPVSFSWLP